MVRWPSKARQSSRNFALNLTGDERHNKSDRKHNVVASTNIDFILFLPEWGKWKLFAGDSRLSEAVTSLKSTPGGRAERGRSSDIFAFKPPQGWSENIDRVTERPARQTLWDFLIFELLRRWTEMTFIFLFKTRNKGKIRKKNHSCVLTSCGRNFSKKIPGYFPVAFSNPRFSRVAWHPACLWVWTEIINHSVR